MKVQTRIVLLVASLLFAAIAVFVFFTVYDPDTVSSSTTRRFEWMVLCPAALILASVTRGGFWLTGLGMALGVLLGLTVRFLLPPLQSNIWPIAAIVWSALLLLPILLGSAVGGFGRWCSREQ